MFSKLTTLVKVKQKPELPTKMWRSGMWVVYQTKPAILVTVDTPCVIHLVDEQGVTYKSESVGIEQLRQANYSDIPVARRGVTLEKAKELGYAS